MEHRPNITIASREIEDLTIGVHPSNLRGYIGRHAHKPPTDLINQFESLEIQISAITGQQRIQIFHSGRYNKRVPPSLENIQHHPSQFLQSPRVRWKYFIDTVG
jgi:hypothetical protein